MTDPQIEVVPTVITIGESYGGRAPTFTIEHAKFFGRPNFSGELDRFKDDRRKFSVRIPDEAVEALQRFGYNVKTTVPDADAVEQGLEPVNHLKVMLNFKIPDDKKGRPDEMKFERGPDIWVMQGDDTEKLNSLTVGILDRSRFENMDMEIRGWEYDADENPGMLSARLVQFVGVLRPSIIASKYAGLR